MPDSKKMNFMTVTPGASYFYYLPKALMQGVFSDLLIQKRKINKKIRIIKLTNLGRPADRPP